MGTSPLAEVTQLVRLLEATQAETLALLARKREAMRRADAAGLLRLVRPEEELVERTRVLLGHRTRILRRASQTGLPGDSLHALLGHLDDPRAEALREKVRQIQRTADEIQRENRIHWVIARSALASCEGILELISRRGQKAPLIGKGAGRPAGALIDASV